MNGVHLVMGTPNAYMQEVGLIHAAGEWIAKWGKRIFIVTGAVSWESVNKKLTASLDRADIVYEYAVYEGECSYNEIERLSAMVLEGTELIVAVGAGKVTDIAKKLSHGLKLPFIAIPTLAATCAAATNLSVMYTDDGHYYDSQLFLRNTLLVLIDTDVVAKAPPRYLIAGIGSTLARWYEASACASDKRHNVPTISGLQAARLGYDTIMKYGVAAVEDARQENASFALQQVIDAIVLCGGMVSGLGEDNCRWAAAHAIYNGLITLPEQQALHGEMVAYGTLVQLILEGRQPAEINELLAFYELIGLPVKLQQLGIKYPIEGTEEHWMSAVLSAAGTIGNMPFEVTAEALTMAVKQLEHWE